MTGSLNVKRVMKAIDGLDEDEQDDLRLALVEILDPEERLDFFDDLGDMYCTACGESLPEAYSKDSDHECSEVNEEDEDDAEEDLTDDGLTSDENPDNDRDTGDVEDETNEAGETTS